MCFVRCDEVIVWVFGVWGFCVVFYRVGWVEGWGVFRSNLSLSLGRKGGRGREAGWQLRPRASKYQPWKLLRYAARSEEHTSELQSLMRISYAVFCLKKKNKKIKRRQIDKATKKH